MIFFNSSLSPLRLINIKISFEVTCPMSPWLAFEASKKKEGVPILIRITIPERPECWLRKLHV